MSKLLATNDDAVSPVMGTILMVAIGVVLAGAMFFVVAGLGAKDKGTPPDMRFIRDDTLDRLQVIKVNPAVARDQFDIKMSAPGDFEADGPVTAGAHAVPTANVWVPVAGAPGGPGAGFVEAGSSFSFCADGGGSAVPGVTVEFRHRPTNAVVFRGAFISMDSCP